MRYYLYNILRVTFFILLLYFLLVPSCTRFIILYIYTARWILYTCIQVHVIMYYMIFLYGRYNNIIGSYAFLAITIYYTSYYYYTRRIVAIIIYSVYRNNLAVCKREHIYMRTLCIAYWPTMGFDTFESYSCHIYACLYHWQFYGCGSLLFIGSGPWEKV